MQEFILQVKDLTKIFNEKKDSFKAVDHINFVVKTGEILGLLGANGAGKTTTLSMIMGILEPTYGHIEIFGKDFKKKREEILQDMNFASAYTRAPWRLTVKEHLSVFADIYNIKNKNIKINNLITTFNLEKHINKWCGDLSAGNMAKLNLAKAFINDPKIILLDEPTSSIDPDIANDVRKFILKAQESWQTTVIITSHNMSEIEELCDRVIFMASGRIIAEDSPENLARQITTSKVKLMMQDGQKRTMIYCKKNKYKYETNEKEIGVTLPENRIAELLKDLTVLGVEYAEITIEKPSLEDFFMVQAKKAKDLSILNDIKNKDD